MSHASPQPKREVSEKKRAANRANAKKSTGPRTPQGKARVSLNALTHGLTAQTAVLPFENADHFEKFAACLRADLKPAGFLQTLLAERVIDLAWKLRRASKAQLELTAEIFDEDMYQHKVVVEHGAYVGPYVPINPAWMVAVGVEGGKGYEKEVAFVGLDLYADRLQRAMTVALTRLRREQDRAAKAGEAPASAEVEVELREDHLENAVVKNKATAGDEPVRERIDLRSFIREPYLKEIGEDDEEAERANSENKATEGGGEARTKPPTPKERDARVPAPAVEKAAPEDPPSQAVEASAGPVQPAATRRGSDPQPWRELPPWDPMRVSDN